MTFVAYHAYGVTCTLCHPFGQVPTPYIRPVEQELADLRLVMGKIRTELALKQGRSTPLRNGNCGYVAHDEYERELIKELNAYARYFRGLMGLLLHGVVGEVPEAPSPTDAEVLGKVAMFYHRAIASPGSDRRRTAARKWLRAVDDLKAFYDRRYSV